jgi:AcrR family transcriptional regulator
MKKSERTRQLLLDTAGRHFQQVGYSASALRDIAGEAGVDVALIAHYFGNKPGLFTAVFEALLEWHEAVIVSHSEPLPVLIAEFSQPVAADGPPRLGLMLLANARDPEVGAQVRSGFAARVSEPLIGRLSGTVSPQGVALIFAVFLGLVQARDGLELADLTGLSQDRQAALLDLLITALAEVPKTGQAAAADSTKIEGFPARSQD